MADLIDFEAFKLVGLSDYARKLPSNDLAVYLDKLSVENGTLPDPFDVSDLMWVDNVKLWPDVSYFDICHYFVESTSYYSKSDMKCYKSLDGYQYFQQVMFYDPKMSDMVLLKAYVLPSQRQGSKKDMYSTYLIVKRDGQIHTVHCTCMAGVGKACSHAAALAYKVEAAIRMGMKKTACTSSLCAWNDMSRKKAQPAQLSDIDFKRPRYGDDVRSETVATPSRSKEVGRIDFEHLRKLQPNAVVFSCIDVKEQRDLPPTIISCVNDINSRNIATTDILNVMGESLNDRNISNLEQLTVTQSKSPIWKLHRRGRITSSTMHRVFTLKDTTDRISIIKQLLEPKTFSTDATRYGIKNEHVARRSYMKYQSLLHGDSFKCSESGLLLNKTYPHLGASPDGIVECNCCGKGCLEIKCLHKFSSGVPDPRSEEAKNDNSFPVNENFELKRIHKFYSQVQGHMLISDLPYCDFYLWSKSNSLTVRVERDHGYIERLKTKLLSVFVNDVIPVIIKQNE